MIATPKTSTDPALTGAGFPAEMSFYDAEIQAKSKKAEEKRKGIIWRIEPVGPEKFIEDFLDFWFLVSLPWRR